MYDRQLRLISFAAFVLLLFLLIFFSDLPRNVIISIGIMMVFLMIFTYVFKTNVSPLLKVVLILTSFIVLPVFILLYLGILNAFPQLWMAILALVAVVIVGVLSIQIIIGLDIVELKWD